MSPPGTTGSVAHDHRQRAAEAGESPAAVAALTPVYEAYLALQMALASDDLETAKEAAGQLGARTAAVDMTRFSPAGHIDWMKLASQLSEHASRIAGADDIDAARNGFYTLSQVVIELQGSFGHIDSSNYYLTFCPMARDNQGAYWLQKIDTIYNPYFGASMLRCGEIKESLPPRSAARN